LGLTRREFAARFSLDLDSIQNWEQGRYLPDNSSRILPAVIDRHAEAVEDVLEWFGGEDAPPLAGDDLTLSIQAASGMSVI